jgi:polyisoprenoid-binding protein YceI
MQIPTQRLSIPAVCMIVLFATGDAGICDPPAPDAAAANDAAPRELHAGDVDTELSRVYVFVGKKRLGHEHGVEGMVQEGEIHLESSDSPGKIVFDMTSFAADTDAARDYVGLEGTTSEDERSDVTSTMTGSKVLHVKEHPTATFEISSIKKLDEQTEDGHPLYEFAGKFTLHGETNDIEFRGATTEEKNSRVRLQGDFRIKQSDYGIKPYSAFFGAVAVTDELKVYGDLWIVKE